MGLFEANLSKSLPAEGSPDGNGDNRQTEHYETSSRPERRIPRPEPTTFPLAAMRACVDQKGLDVRGLDISGSDIADFFIIVSGTSERHVKGIADKVQQTLQQFGETPLSVSGYEGGEWVLIDYGDLVVHVFYEPMRQYYGLDELWGKRGQPIEPEPDLERHMRMLRTGITW